jgi:hypothetical protein
MPFGIEDHRSAVAGFDGKQTGMAAPRASSDGRQGVVLLRERARG